MQLSPTLRQFCGPLVRRRLAMVGVVAVSAVLASCATGKVPSGEDLKGTWSQTGAGFERGKSVIWQEQTVVIERADRQGFAGFKEYTSNGGPLQKESLSGVVGPTGEILIVDEDGVFHGRMIGGNILGQYAEVGDDSAAINIELRRDEPNY